MFVVWLSSCIPGYAEMKPSKIHKNNSSGHHKLLRPKSWCQLFMYNSQWCQWKFHEHIWKQMMSFITARENTNQQSPDETWVLSVSLQAPPSCQDYPFTWQSGKITKKKSLIFYIFSIQLGGDKNPIYNILVILTSRWARFVHWYSRDRDGALSAHIS